MSNVESLKSMDPAGGNDLEFVSVVRGVRIGSLQAGRMPALRMGGCSV
jgi:hypothetical protein